jgi:hypothetical protein
VSLAPLFRPIFSSLPLLFENLVDAIEKRKDQKRADCRNQ